LKALYQRDLMGCPPESLRDYCRQHGPAEAAEFAEELVSGCIEQQDTLDRIIGQTAENWQMDRMAAIDRNILRIAAWELLFADFTPPKVAINEAIELAKRYSTESSPTFVNGLLDRIYNEHVAKCNPAESSPQDGPRKAPDASSGCGRNSTSEAMRRFDLHVHSAASDGTFAPAELAGLAVRAGLAGFALTDHDSIEGVHEAEKACQEAGLELIPGVELTAYTPAASGEIEVHLLGLFVDPEAEGLRQVLVELREERVRRIEIMSRKLRQVGVQIESEDVLKRSLGGSVGRVHLAAELVRQGICRDANEAFDKYIGFGRPGYVPKRRMSPAEAIELVRAAGGCAVLAHPVFIKDSASLIRRLAEEGLVGLEVHYPLHNARQEKELLELARALNLVPAGGSDFHGGPRPDIHVGHEAVSGLEVERLRMRAPSKDDLIRQHGGA